MNEEPYCSITLIIFFYPLHIHLTSTDALSLDVNTLPYSVFDFGALPSGFIKLVCTPCWYSWGLDPPSLADSSGKKDSCIPEFIGLKEKDCGPGAKNVLESTG